MGKTVTTEHVFKISKEDLLDFLVAMALDEGTISRDWEDVGNMKVLGVEEDDQDVYLRARKVIPDWMQPETRPLKKRKRMETGG